MCAPQVRAECMQVEREGNYAHAHFTITERHPRPQLKFHFSSVQVRRLIFSENSLAHISSRPAYPGLTPPRGTSNFGMVARNAAEI